MSPSSQIPAAKPESARTPAANPAADPASPAQHPTGEPILSVRSLSKSFGANTVLKDIDLTIHAGEVVALIGPSGSGKTTVLRSLNGLETPDGGTVSIRRGELVHTADFDAKLGRRQLKAHADALRDATGFVFQNYNLFPHRTVLENIMEGPVLVHKRPKAEVRAEALELLERVGLAHRADAYPAELSGGQQQRVGIVRALALKPSLLLFDEPTSALDPELVGDILKVMRDLAAQGWTMLVVTHELHFARQVASQIVFMDGGVVVEEGPAAAVLDAPQQERTQRFLQRIIHPEQDL